MNAVLESFFEMDEFEIEEFNWRIKVALKETYLTTMTIHYSINWVFGNRADPTKGD